MLMRHFGPEVRGAFRSDGWSGLEILHALVLAATLATLIAVTVWIVTSMRARVAVAVAAPAASGAAAGAGSAAPAVTAPSNVAAEPDAAATEVRMRYARGEITREEFVQISRDLGEEPSAPEA